MLVTNILLFVLRRSDECSRIVFVGHMKGLREQTAEDGSRWKMKKWMGSGWEVDGKGARERRNRNRDQSKGCSV